MELKDQVCSLELAKKLKKLGVNQESLFYYASFENPLLGHLSEELVHNNHWFLSCSLNDSDSYDWSISAFTLSELGSILSCDYHSGKTDVTYYCKYGCDIRNEWYMETGETECDARAKLIIYLIENKIITELGNES